MELDIRYKIKRLAGSYILYDVDLISDPGLELFDRNYHSSNESSSQSCLSGGAGTGRAKVIYFRRDNKDMVLKHYFRGGLVSSFLKDQYFGFNIEKTRAFKEWYLLKKMRKLGLPVPDAIAAHVDKNLFYYRADLITQKVNDTDTLADVLTVRDVGSGQWRKIAACIKRFHDNNIYHADLNARNILLTEAGQVYLIDFDNSDFRVESESWKMGNLARLKRSLLKFKNNESGFNFSEDDWSSFMEGYGSAHN